MSTEDVVRVSELQAAQRRSLVRHDLDALLFVVSDETLLKRWAVQPHLTIADLRRVKRDYAKAHHPDRSATPLEANRRVGKVNALIDRALQNLEEQS